MLETITNENGFSEIVDKNDDILSPADRVPVLGDLTIQLDVAKLASEIRDLKLFFMFEFQEE